MFKPIFFCEVIVLKQEPKNKAWHEFIPSGRADYTKYQPTRKELPKFVSTKNKRIIFN